MAKRFIKSYAVVARNELGNGLLNRLFARTYEGLNPSDCTNFMKKNTNKTNKINNWSTVRVEKWSHDRWSGPELLSKREFKSQGAAERYCNKINSKNTAPVAPDYYVEAHIV